MSYRVRNVNQSVDNMKVSRSPKDYRPSSHCIQHAKERGYGKDHYIKEDAEGMEKHGVQGWIIQYLIESGNVHCATDKNCFVFKAEIPDNHGSHEWWLPVELNSGEKNILKTSPYVSGIPDSQIRMLRPFKPDDLEK
jgi:hypothetical protein